MSILVKSLEIRYTEPTPVSKVSFEVVNQVGIFQQTMAHLTVEINGEYAISTPELQQALVNSLLGTQWEQ